MRPAWGTRKLPRTPAHVFPPPGAMLHAARRAWRAGAWAAGPFAWLLVALGAAVCAAPGVPYTRVPPGGEDPGRRVGGNSVRVTLGAAPGAWVGIDERHLRAASVVAEGPPFSTDMPNARARLGLHRVNEYRFPRWGLAHLQQFDGDVSAPSGRDPRTGRRAYRQVFVTVGIVWLLGGPLLWCGVRLWRGAPWRGRGEPRPPGLTWRLARPWAATLGLIGAFTLALGRGPVTGHMHDFGETAIVGGVRADPFTPAHPRFLRLAVDRPGPPAKDGGRTPARPTVTVGSRARGLQAYRADGVRWDARVPSPPWDYHEAPAPGRTRRCAEVSLWYVAAIPLAWSGAALVGAARRRLSRTHASG